MEEEEFQREGEGEGRKEKEEQEEAGAPAEEDGEGRRKGKKRRKNKEEKEEIWSDEGKNEGETKSDQNIKKKKIVTVIFIPPQHFLPIRRKSVSTSDCQLIDNKENGRILMAGPIRNTTQTFGTNMQQMKYLGPI